MRVTQAMMRAYRNDCVGAIDDIDFALTKPVGDDDEEDGVSLRILRAHSASMPRYGNRHPIRTSTRNSASSSPKDIRKNP